MTTKYIDTNSIPQVRAPGAQGAHAEILNRALCGAERAHGVLRWLNSGDCFDAASKSNAHQLIYLMAGEGVIMLDAKAYPVAKGSGVYLAPSESTKIRQAGTATLKLFHLTVPSGR
jgi:glyoxylate utilization-related uncharacterized protein